MRGCAISMKVSKYIDVARRYALYGENGYYVDAHILDKMIVEELKLSMTFEEIRELVSRCEVILTEDKIKEFLEQKRRIRYPNLEKAIKNYKPIPTNLTEVTIEDIKKQAENFGNIALYRRYHLESYTLHYFKTYISILKEKCKTLFDIFDDLEELKKGIISKEGRTRFNDLDFHFNSYGDVYIEDLERLGNPIIYNVKKLYDKTMQANNPETYETFKMSKQRLKCKGAFESDFYPSKEVQIKELHYASEPEFIALSKKQKEELRNKEWAILDKMFEEGFLEEDIEPKKEFVKK